MRKTEESLTIDSFQVDATGLLQGKRSMGQHTQTWRTTAEKMLGKQKTWQTFKKMAKG